MSLDQWRGHVVPQCIFFFGGGKYTFLVCLCLCGVHVLFFRGNPIALKETPVAPCRYNEIQSEVFEMRAED